MFINQNKNIMRTWINRIILVSAGVFIFSSCKKDEVKTVLTGGATPSLQTNNTTLVLLQANANNDAVKFTYTGATFGFDAAVTYVLQIAKGGTSFASATTTEVGLTNASPLEKSFKVVDFNRELLKIIPYGTVTPIEVRVKATVAAAAAPSYSNVVTITATAYRDLITYAYPNALNIAGNYQGWSPGTAPQIVKQNNGGYNGFEGYIIFNDPAPKFKMVKGDNWGAGDFGTAGGNNLGNGGSDLSLPSGGPGIAGYWRIRADLTATPAPGQWYWDKINRWAIIGEFNGWSDPDVAMTFNAATGVWSITRDMPAGKFKFRANSDWGINLGDNGADSKPEYGGADISITTAGNYTISLDLSAGGNYAYTLKKN
jgi:hypothetical protein